MTWLEVLPNKLLQSNIMKIFSYIWLFPTWFTLTILTGPKETGKFSSFVEEALWIYYSLATILNFSCATLILCGYMGINNIK